MPKARSLPDMLALPAAVMLAGIVFFCFLLRAHHALWFMPFVDETEHILGGRMLLAGGVLYRDFVDSHGPLAYFLGEISGLIPGIAQPGAARLVMLSGTLATSCAVATSPCLQGPWERICALALFIGLTASLWMVQGLCMLDYQPLAGMLLVIGCAHFTFCAWCRARPTLVNMAVAGAAFGLVPFTAYAYAPSMVLLITSGMALFAQPRDRWAFWAGLGGAVAVMGAWMLWQCDLLGYVSYHIVLNQFYFAPYIHFNLTDVPVSFIPHTRPGLLAQTIATMAAGLGFLLLNTRADMSWRSAWMLGLGLLGVAMSNPKGNPGFQNGAFVLLAFGLLSLGLARLPRMLELVVGPGVRLSSVCVFALVIISTELAARRALTAPHGYTRAEMTALPPLRLTQSDAPWARRLRRIVPAHEPILVLEYRPNVYIEARRLPMRGFDHYFPWDADYARHPWFGHGRDICAALRNAPPPVIYDTDWLVWGLYAPKTYMSCVQSLRAKLYQQVESEPPIYVRKDLVAAWRAPL